MASSDNESTKSNTQQNGAQSASHGASAGAGAGDSASASTSTSVGQSANAERDDLTRIKGIGGATSRLLASHSITTYSDVANQTPKSLETMMADGGPAFASNNPTTWPEQARLAADGKWDAIDKEFGADGLRIAENSGAGPTGVSSGSAAASASAASSPRSNSSGVKRDDLTTIVGIGPKASELLNADGIESYNDLANSDQAKLRNIIERGGSRFALLDATTWPEQASLAAGGEWDKLSAMQSAMSDTAFPSKPLAAGTTPAATPDAPSEKPKQPARSSGKSDDLAKIEGIGPKIAQVLRDAGINSFLELSATPESTLKLILEKAGPRFVLADPATWAEQAELAAADRWDDLTKLQDNLDGGRRVT